jgi:hypothetical protein
MNTAQLVYDLSGSYDVFNRFRISDEFTLFDCKLLYDKQSQLWDDQQTLGTNNDTNSIFNSNQASVTLRVASNTNCQHVRQTYQRFSYQPGKSQLIMMTGIIGEPQSGITRRLGIFDNSNGLFFESSSNECFIVKRDSTQGFIRDMRIAQKDWNKNKLMMDDEYVLNCSKANIFYFNYEWLGVGDLICGVVLGAKFIPLHQFYSANNVTTVTMSVPNLPLRYEINNNGTGSNADLTCICSTVISEGGQQGFGQVYSIDRGTNSVSVSSSGVLVGLFAFRIAPNKEAVNIYIEGLNIVSTSQNVVFRWAFYLNPTLSSPISYTSKENSCLEYNNTMTTITISGGSLIYSGYGVGTKTSILIDTLAAKFSLGTSILGVPDVFVLAIERLDNQTNVFYGSVSIRESI